MSEAAGRLDELVEAAGEARERAYAPYSRFTVGAAVLAGGRVFAGCNVENASYGVSICAERGAAMQAVAAGETRFDAVAVVGSAEEPTPPCGACRQFLSEFTPPDAPVVVETPSGEREVWTMGEILPHPFGPEFLS
ncbi:MAG: cytidine deaminase [Actinobacteria bacterium]|nr:cytidine deaminase [Actinomycetota bacterium]